MWHHQAAKSDDTLVPGKRLRFPSKGSGRLPLFRMHAHTGDKAPEAPPKEAAGRLGPKSLSLSFYRQAIVGSLVDLVP